MMWTRSLAVLPLLTVLAGCNLIGVSSASPTFPQHGGFGGTGPAGLVQGKLVLEAGCLMFESPGPGYERTLLVWPSSYVLLGGGAGVLGDGVELLLGDVVLLGGGEYTDEAWVKERLIGPPVKPECLTGRYALITSMPQEAQ